MFSIYTYLRFVLCGCAECIAYMRVYVYGVVRMVCSNYSIAYNYLIISNFTPPRTCRCIVPKCRESVSGLVSEFCRFAPYMNGCCVNSRCVLFS